MSRATGFWPLVEHRGARETHLSESIWALFVRELLARREIRVEEDARSRSTLITFRIAETESVYRIIDASRITGGQYEYAADRLVRDMVSIYEEPASACSTDQLLLELVRRLADDSTASDLLLVLRDRLMETGVFVGEEF